MSIFWTAQPLTIHKSLRFDLVFDGEGGDEDTYTVTYDNAKWQKEKSKPKQEKKKEQQGKLSYYSNAFATFLTRFESGGSKLYR